MGFELEGPESLDKLCCRDHRTAAKELNLSYHNMDNYIVNRRVWGVQVP